MGVNMSRDSCVPPSKWCYHSLETSKRHSRSHSRQYFLSTHLLITKFMDIVRIPMHFASLRQLGPLDMLWFLLSMDIGSVFSLPIRLKSRLTPSYLHIPVILVVNGSSNEVPEFFFIIARNLFNNSFLH